MQPNERVSPAKHTHVRAGRLKRQAPTLSARPCVPLSQALAELQAADAREVAAGNTDTINGFYQSKHGGEMGRKHQHLIIRKQYQTGDPNPNPNPNPNQVGLRISPDLMAGLMVSFLL